MLLGASYWEIKEQVKELFEQLKEQLEWVSIFDATSSCN